MTDRQKCVVMALATVVMAVAVTAASVAPVDADASGVERVGGADRYHTAVEVATMVGGGSLTGLDRLIIVSGESYAEGLTAPGLAGFLDQRGEAGQTAILLTRSSSLPSVVRNAIRASGVPATQVLLLGGASSVSETVRDAIARAAGWNGVGANPVVRIAGEDAYGTAAAVVEYARTTAGSRLPESYRTVVVVSGEHFADALVAGALAYRNGHFVVLAAPSGAPQATLDAVGRLQANCALLIGGSRAVAPLVATQMEVVLDATEGCGVERIAGRDRYETAAQLGSRFVTHNGPVQRPILASGAGFVDALVAAPLAAGNRPLMLTAPDQLSAPTSEWLYPRRVGVTDVVIIGGTRAISPEVARAVGELIATSPTPNRGITGPSALGLSFASTAYSHAQSSQIISPSVTGAIGSTTFTATGTLPPGVTFDSATGQFTGPVAVNLNASQISTGHDHTCALLSDSTARCWGRNDTGQLGDGTTTMRSIPVTVVDTGSGTTLSGITQISAGFLYTCAVLVDATARCWGDNGAGRLGDGTITMRSIPVTVTTGAGTALSGITQIAAGETHACAVLADATARCWGNNFYGQLGNGSTANNEVIPVVVTANGGAALSGITQISANFNYTCALLSASTAQCWGRNNVGQLGDGSTTDRAVSATVTTGAGTALSGITQIAAGETHACALMADATARCWGGNWSGKLGDGTTVDRWVPATVTTGAGTALSGVTHISGGDNHTCAALADLTARCWGANNSGRLGDGTTTSRLLPVVVTTSAGTALGRAMQMSASAVHSCAVLSDGTARCWGTGSFGRLGDGLATDSSVPVEVVDFGNQGWPAAITVTVTDAAGRTASVDIVLIVA